MLISCTSCGTHFELADASLPGRKMRLQCPICRKTLILDNRKVGIRSRTPDPDNEYFLWLQRLAGALVSDILYYNRDKVAKARSNECILVELADEIHMAWTDYKSRLERINPRARDIFNAAVNRILGQGRRIF